MPSRSSAVLNTVRDWYDALPKPRGQRPAKGSLAIGLVILERLKDECDLTIGAHLAPGKAQIQGLSGPAVHRILEEYGESRPFLEHGGRTNRGGPAVAENLLSGLDAAGLTSLADDDRRSVLERAQELLVAHVREFFALERLKPGYSPNDSTRQFVSRVLELARQDGKHGPVAQYLVGAKLELRFPDEEIRNDSSSAAGRIAVESIESFVSQNVEELSYFSGDGIRANLRSLIETYNERVDAVEFDKSMMIEIPPNLV